MDLVEDLADPAVPVPAACVALGLSRATLYRCAVGACRDSCSTSQDCADGYDCASARCVLTSADGRADAAPADLQVEWDSGCSCRSVDDSRNDASSTVAVLALLAAAASRRRRASQ